MVPQRRGVVGRRLLERLGLDVDVEVDGRVRERPHHLGAAALAAHHQAEQEPAVHDHLLDVVDPGALSGEDVAQARQHARVVATGDGDERAHAADAWP